MTAPREDLAVPLALLELYSALDLAVMQNPDIGPLVDQYLPGASANPGWSAQLYELFAPGVPRLDDVDTAVATGLSSILAISESQGVTDGPPITIPDLSNIVYAVGTLKHLGIEPPDNLYARVLSLAVPEGISDPLGTATEFLNGQLEEEFWGWDSWPKFIKDAAAAGYVDELVSDVPQCRTGVVTVNGYESVVIDADCESNTVTFNKLKDVIDPRNWPKSYPSFFCKMEDHQPCGDDWYSIKETAGFCYVSGGYKLVTRLKYIKTDQTDLDARLDFDLAADQTGCDKKVKVDRGFINITCTRSDKNPALGGVKMRTRKVAHVEGIDPYAQAISLCKLGYGWAAVQTFFGPAMDKPPIYDPYKWNTQPYKKEDPKVPGPGTGSGSGGGSGGASGNANQSAGGSSGSPATPPVLEVATKTAETLKETAEYLTNTHLTITKKWLAGQLSFGDLATYSGQVGAKLASEPWAWLQKIVTPGSGPGGGSSGSGGSTP